MCPTLCEHYSSCLRPNWANGWSNFSKHKDFNHYFSGFFHFSSQYIARSYQINLIGALNLSYNTEADFRHTMLTEFRKARNERSFLSEKEMYKVKSNVINSHRHKQLVFWYDKMNALDPLINRTIFNLNRAIKLRETFLIEEIITALDKTMNVLEQYWKERVNAVDEIRMVMMRDLGFNENDVLIMQHLYELRCYFGAHPSHSKWWDISEIYDHHLDEIYNIVIKVVMKVVLHENQHRKVIKYSDDWSEWFKEYCMILWKSVWFETIPPNFS